MIDVIKTIRCGEGVVEHCSAQGNIHAVLSWSEIYCRTTMYLRSNLKEIINILSLFRHIDFRHTLCSVYLAEQSGFYPNKADTSQRK